MLLTFQTPSNVCATGLINGRNRILVLDHYLCIYLEEMHVCINAKENGEISKMSFFAYA